MELKGYKLKFDKGQLFHFGQTDKNNSEIIFHSDSLFSALAVNYMYDKDNNIDNLLNSIEELSSVFFTLKNKDFEVYFIPKPIIKLNFSKGLIKSNRKIIKKLKFISLGVLEKINLNEEITENNCVTLDNDSLMITKNEFENLNLKRNIKFIYKKIENRVNIKEKEDNELFSVESFYFNPGLDFEFYFFAKINDEETFEKSLSNLIGFGGLGGLISVGKGNLKGFEKFEINYDVDNFNRYLNLGVIVPNFDLLKEEELNNKIESFSIIKRNGWVYNNTIKRKNLTSFGEGSIFLEKLKSEEEVDLLSETKKKELNYEKVIRFVKSYQIPLRINENNGGIN